MNYDDLMLNALLNRQMGLGVQVFADGTEMIAPEPDLVEQMTVGTPTGEEKTLPLETFAKMAADVPAGLLKGGVQGSIGLAGDIISLMRGVYDLGASGGDLNAFLEGLEKPTGMPTTEDVKEFFDETLGIPLVPEGADETRKKAARVSEFVGELGGGGKTAVEGTKAVARATKRVVRKKAVAPVAAAAVPIAVEKPKGQD
jgi:hypothetical protein